MSHPSEEVLAEFTRGSSSGHGSDALWGHLAECERCRTRADRVAMLHRAASALGSTEHAVGDPQGLGVPAEDPSSLAIIPARLVFDNLRHPLPAGLRGPGPDRHLVFEADHWGLDVRLSRRGAFTGITGQLMDCLALSRRCEGVRVTARSGPDLATRTVTNAWGEFTLDWNQSRLVHLELLVPRAVIQVSLPDLTL